MKTKTIFIVALVVIFLTSSLVPSLTSATEVEGIYVKTNKGVPWYDLETRWEYNWSKKEKKQYKFQLGLQIADLATTIYVLERGIGEEANPVFGEHPSAKKLIAGKVIGNALIFVALNQVPKGEKVIFLRIINILMTAVVINNSMLGAGISF